MVEIPWNFFFFLLFALGLRYFLYKKMTKQTEPSKTRKSKKLWEQENKAKGDEFERHIGTLLESDGWQVNYNGFLKRKSDGGLDLICKKENITKLIQCKYRTNTETEVIRENDVNQLRGSMEVYKKENPGEKVSAAIATTAKLSEEAIKAAEIHGIEVVDKKIIDFKLKL